MTCYRPVSGYLGRGGAFVPVRAKSLGQVPVVVPCRRCVGCLLDKAEDWSTRIAHEASLHAENSFLTLTYSDAELPPFGSLAPRDLQLFMKRLRKSLAPKRVRFFACGEYGGKGNRPHYHVILFGHQFGGLVVQSKSAAGFFTYRSAELEALWARGFSSIGQVTAQSGGYVARYATKKLDAPIRARPVFDEHGEVLGELAPEFCVMSRRPGVGFLWAAQFMSDAFPSGFVIVDGQPRRPPRAYAERWRASAPQSEVMGFHHEKVLHGLANASERSPERLRVKEELALLRFDKLKRDLGET